MPFVAYPRCVGIRPKVAVAVPAAAAVSPQIGPDPPFAAQHNIEHCTDDYLGLHPGLHHAAGW
jgi:hypothetical protein